MALREKNELRSEFTDSETTVQVTKNRSGKPHTAALQARLLHLEKENERIHTENKHLKGHMDAVTGSLSLVEFSADGTILTANAHFLRAMGYELNEIEGRHHSLFQSTATAAAEEQALWWRKLSAGEACDGQFHYKAKNGNDVWLQGIYSPIAGEGGEVLKVVQLSLNITAEKEAAAQMQREIDARMKSVDEACIVSEVDLKGYITYVNDKHCEVSQYSREELIGANQNIVRHPDMPKEVFKEMWATIGRGGIYRGLIKNRRKDGTPYYVDGVFTPIPGRNGKPVKYIGLRYEITKETLEKQRMKGIVVA